MVRRRLTPAERGVTGSVQLEGQELIGRSERAMGRVRGLTLAMVPQDPMASLNPIRHIGSQLAEGCRLHLGLSRSNARKRVLEYLGAVR